MSGRYESIRHDRVIIFKGLTAYKPVFDVTTLQTMSTNELHQFPQKQNPFGLIYDKMIATLFIADVTVC